MRNECSTTTRERLYQQNNMAALETAVLRPERAAEHKYSGTLFKGKQM